MSETLNQTPGPVPTVARAAPQEASSKRSCATTPVHGVVPALGSSHWPGRKDLMAVFHAVLTDDRRAPHAAVIDLGSEYTYLALRRRVEHIAAILADEQFDAARPVAVAMPQGFEYVACVLGALFAGRSFLPVDPAYPAQRIAHMLRDSNASCVLHDSRLSIDVVQQLAVRFIDTSIAPPSTRPSALSVVESEQPIYLIYTSGTTGLPKWVPILAAGLHNFLREQGDYLEVSAQSVFAATSSVSFDMSIWEIFLCLFHGARIATFARQVILDGRALGEALVQHRVTHLLMTPSMLSILPRADYPDLRHVVSAGEKCPTSLVEFWGDRCNFHDAYGATEATIYSTVTRKTVETTAPDVGLPMRGNDILITNENGRPVPVGEVGEICIGGVGVSPGYVNRPDLNAAKFVRIEGRAYYRTGDVGSLTVSGSLQFKGRKDKQVKLNGFRIELEEIESVGNRTGLIDSCHAAIHTAGTSGLSTLILFVVTRKSIVFDQATLKGRLGEFLPAYMVPNRIVPVAELPMTVNGKVDSAALLSTLS
jgi:amino acid adenylation domain-containing protein